MVNVKGYFLGLLIVLILVWIIMDSGSWENNRQECSYPNCWLVPCDNGDPHCVKQVLCCKRDIFSPSGKGYIVDITYE